MSTAKKGTAENRERARRLKALSDFLEKKYREWKRIKTNQEPEFDWTRGDWARYLDVGESQLSLYLSGRRWPRPDSIEQLALRLGDEVYDLLGLTRPDRKLIRLNDAWDGLRPEARARIDAILDEELGSKRDNEDNTDATTHGPGMASTG